MQIVGLQLVHELFGELLHRRHPFCLLLHLFGSKLDAQHLPDPAPTVRYHLFLAETPLKHFPLLPRRNPQLLQLSLISLLQRPEVFVFFIDIHLSEFRG